MDHRFPSGSLTLAGHLARPPLRSSPTPAAGMPALVLSHGFPSGARGAETSASTFPELADRIANELGIVVLTFTFRGAGESEGDFSLDGWLADITAAVDHLTAIERISGMWLAGFGTGGALALCAAARDARISGVAALGAPTDFADWGSQPRRLLEHSREIGLIVTPGFPESFDRWARPLREIRAVLCVTRVAPRPLLIVHGTDDDAVPDLDARVIANAHGSAELRFIAGAGHRLRHDPRAVAVLLGWLSRQRHSQPGADLALT